MSAKVNFDKPILGILLGDATGIGPEIVAKAIAKGIVADYCFPVIIGDVRVLEAGMRIAHVDFRYTVIESIKDADWTKGIPILNQNDLNPEDITLGEVSAISGKVTGDMLVTAVNLYKHGDIDGFCFAPLNKAAMKLGGYHVKSEHELFAQLFEWSEPSGEVNMLDNVWTTRVTSHIPLKDVSASLTMDSILRAIKLADSTLQRAGMQNGRIAVAALNPHAGESGLCGREEDDVIRPTVAEARKLGINVSGPYPPDILFVKAFDGHFDAVVTMYHDQGQIAMKLKRFDYGVTISAGLPAPITTPAHGTAFDIVGQGVAKITAFESALKIAAKMATKADFSKNPD